MRFTANITLSFDIEADTLTEAEVAMEINADVLTRRLAAERAPLPYTATDPEVTEQSVDVPALAERDI